MDREVFILPDGESFSAWEVRFGRPKRRREACPCTIQELNGSIRNGTLSYTVESASVSFCASQGSLKVGQQGQLSSSDDRFFDVMISRAEPVEDHLLVSGQATGKYLYKRSP
jgi:hypothetical protein